MPTTWPTSGFRRPDGSGNALPDLVAMAMAVEPSLASRVENRYVAVEIAGTRTVGMAVVDHVRVPGREPMVRVVRAVDRGHSLAMLHVACAR